MLLIIYYICYYNIIVIITCIFVGLTTHYSQARQGLGFACTTTSTTSSNWLLGDCSKGGPLPVTCQSTLRQKCCLV